MDGATFDAFTRLLTESRSRRRLARLLGGFALSGPLTLTQRAAGKKRHKGKGKRRKRHHCRPESLAATCAGVNCGDTRANNCGQEVRCDCPSGFNCLLNGVCARDCSASTSVCADCGPNVICTEPNTEGQVNCGFESHCTDHQVCSTSTNECPRGTQCQPCGIEGNHCLPVADCSGT
jgi:hypothetical protein